VLAGHVDHGKSTLTGRLLADAGALPTGKLDQVRASCERRGVPFEYAFVLDALEAERDQNVTIDASQVWLRLPARDIVFVDAPGHREFLKNMVTGAASADAALLLVAADEGVQEQSRRHGQLLGLLGVEKVVVVVNKMDRADRSAAAFAAIERELRDFLATVGVKPLAFVPVVAREGENLVRKSESMPWYAGEPLLATLAALEPARRPMELPLRFFVQDVYRFDDRRIVAGRIESGTLRVGDRVRFLPSGATSTVRSIERWAAPAADVAVAGDAVGVTLADPIFVERGHVAARDDAQPHVGRDLRARVFWLGRRPLRVGESLKLRLCTLEADVRVRAVESVVDSGTLSSSTDADVVKKGEVADVVLQARAPIVFDTDRALTASARFVLVDERDVAGGGLVLGALGGAGVGALGPVEADERARRTGQRGAVLVSAHAPALLERALFDRGLFTALAGDAATAAVLAGAGVVVVAAGPAPDEAVRLEGPFEEAVAQAVAAVRVSERRRGDAA
jgi:bifunctional enzyme CysN/CysC